MTVCVWPIETLLPHAGELILLDAVTDFDDDSVIARAEVKPDGPYSDAHGHLPAWIGLELMAQAVAGWAGCQARTRDQTIQPGFLLGTRHYDCRVPHFPIGARLVIRASRALHDDTGIAVFACDIVQDGQTLAQARLNVFRPPDASAYLQSSLAITP